MYLKVRNHCHVGRKPRRLDCPECGETLKGKKCLAEHFQSVHSASLYKCSTCSKTFKKRKNYANHLKIHEKGAGFECVYCSRLFRFKSYLRRHIKRAHQALTSIEVFEVGSERHHEDNLTNADDADIQLFINWNEILPKSKCTSAWEFSVTFPSSDRKNNCSYETFYNSLGFQSREEWDEWIEISRCLQLPVTADGSCDSFEVAIVKDGKGHEEILIAGSCSEAPLFKSTDFVNSSCESIQLDKLLEELALDEPCPSQNKTPITDKKRKLICCPHCNEAGFKDNWFLQRHIQRMHLVPVKCDICQTTFIDKYWYIDHAKNCFFVCPHDGCPFHVRKSSRLETHLREKHKE